MSDRREDGMNELLREVAQEDARLDGAGLEQRVMARWDAGREIPTVRRKADPTTNSPRSYGMIGALAAAILIAIVATTLRLKPDTTTDAVTKMAALPLTPDSLPLTSNVSAPSERSTPAESTAFGRVARRTSSRPRPVPAEPETFNFFPLVPMSGEELSGSFQIVRVQMPRASLGALATTPDMTNPAELIEADVLLGEDGMARAIRVSSNETGYPWRSR